MTNIGAVPRSLLLLLLLLMLQVGCGSSSTRGSPAGWRRRRWVWRWARCCARGRGSPPSSRPTAGAPVWPSSSSPSTAPCRWAPKAALPEPHSNSYYPFRKQKNVCHRPRYTAYACITPPGAVGMSSVVRLTHSPLAPCCPRRLVSLGAAYPPQVPVGGGGGRDRHGVGLHGHAARVCTRPRHCHRARPSGERTKQINTQP